MSTTPSDLPALKDWRYSVDVENFESIHNHSAYALIENDKRQR